jgi:hypothetical protein
MMAFFSVTEIPYRSEEICFAFYAEKGWDCSQPLPVCSILPKIGQ